MSSLASSNNQNPFSNRRKIINQILAHIFLIFVTITVLFPVMWIVSMAVDPRGVARPTDLNLFPPNANLDAFIEILSQPFSNVLPIYFGEMLMNSLFVALGTALFAVSLGASAAYAFSRFKFIGRQIGMLTFIVLLMLPATGTMIPLFILFNSVQVPTVIAIGVPAFFSAGVVAFAVYLAFFFVKGYLVFNPERSFNPHPALMTGVVIAGTLVAVVVTFFVLFERSPVYAATIDDPMAAAAEPLEEVQDEYNQRSESLIRREGQVVRATRNLQEAIMLSEQLDAIVISAEATDDLSSYLSTQITERRNALPEDANPDRDDVLQALLAADEALTEADEAAALDVLNESLTEAEEDVVSSQDSLDRANTQLEETRQSIADMEATLADVREEFGRISGEVNNRMSQVMLSLVPYYLIAWVSALIVSGVILFVLRALKDQVEPLRAVHIMLYALMAVLTIWLGVQAIQMRMASSNLPPTFTLRLTLFGLSVAFASAQLPFAIWNLKGYFDTIPKDLEEAALIDGAGRIETFFRIMIPLSLPAFAITVLFSFMGSWTEFILSWLFLTGSLQDYTLAMALVSMANGGNTAPPDMQKFAAMALLVSLPIMILFFAAQRWIVSGLTIGGVK